MAKNPEAITVVDFDRLRILVLLCQRVRSVMNLLVFIPLVQRVVVTPAPFFSRHLLFKI